MKNVNVPYYILFKKYIFLFYNTILCLLFFAYILE